MIQCSWACFLSFISLPPCSSGSGLRRIATLARLTAVVLATSVFTHAQVTTLDSQGNVYIATSPGSPNSPTTSGAFQTTFTSTTCLTQPNHGIEGGGGIPFPCPHGYVSKFAKDGSTILAATY